MNLERSESGPVPFLIAVAIPLGLLALAYALWAISDRLLVIGPFDRAAFGWLVVMPVAWAAPGIAGLAWSHLPAESRALAALVVGGTVAVVSAVLLALGATYVGCRPLTSWTDALPITGAIGVVIGLGPAVGSLAAASVATGMSGLRRVVATMATGAIIGVVGVFAAIMTFALFFAGVSCAPVST